MMADNFFELVKKRRNIRQFKPDPVPDEYIEKIIDAARWAMSGGNGQPWEFIVVKNGETKNKIVEFYFEHQKQAYDIEKTRVKELRHHRYIEAPSSLPSFKDAPVFIILCGDPRTVQASVLITHFLPNEGGPMAHLLKNMANAAQILHLAAAALGLGAQWVSVNVTTEVRLKALLDVPEELTIHTIIPIGYPAHEPAPPYRRELKEIIHFEKYDRSKYRSGDDIYNFLLTLRQRTRPAYDLK
ncbi:nitroreductase family protein [Chloroflexota bacterium]